jgi:hypothetical protein
VVQALASAIDRAQLAPSVFDYYDLAHLNELMATETVSNAELQGIEGLRCQWLLPLSSR